MQTQPELTVAQIILAQLGGRRFIAMTGARNAFDLGRKLSFDLPRGCKDRINNVLITLEPNDTYTVRFGRTATSRNKDRTATRYTNHCIAVVEGVYNDQLEEIFTNYTGLATRI